MAGTTSISWTDKTWNPLRGCSAKSAGCTHCYAQKMAGRFSGPGHPYEGLVRKTTQGYKWTGEVRLVEKDLEVPLRWKTPTSIFVNSMSDLFHESVPDQWIDRIFAVMAMAHRHQFQVITKRPERMQAYFTPMTATTEGRVRLSDAAFHLRGTIAEHAVRQRVYRDWPLPNVWLGVSVENQATADERIQWLLQTPAAVRFVSYEPALGPVNFCSLDGGGGYRYSALSVGPPFGHYQYHAKIDQIIVGGESGPKARAFELPWALTVREQCQATGTAFFMKQVGSNAHTGCVGNNGHTLHTHHTHYATKHRAGADPQEWPEALRVQQFPSGV